MRWNRIAADSAAQPKAITSGIVAAPAQPSADAQVVTHTNVKLFQLTDTHFSDGALVKNCVTGKVLDFDAGSTRHGVPSFDGIKNSISGICRSHQLIAVRLIDFNRVCAISRARTSSSKSFFSFRNTAPPIASMRLSMEVTCSSFTSATIANLPGFSTAATS